MLAGLVLAAVTKAPTWDALDQNAAIFGKFTKLTQADVFARGSIFMKKGQCASHPDVVHQYIVGRNPYSCTVLLTTCNPWYSSPTSGLFWGR